MHTTSLPDATLTVRANKIIIDNLDLGEKLAALAAYADAQHSASSGAYEGTQAARKARDEARRIRDTNRARAEQLGQPLDPDQAALDGAAVARAEKAYERAQSNSKTAVSRSADADHVHRKVTAYLNQLATTRTTRNEQQGPMFTKGDAFIDTGVTIVTATFKGDPEAAIAEIDEERKAIERAPLPADEVISALEANLDRQIADAKPRVSFGKKPSISWPVTRVVAEPVQAGIEPVAPAILPWLARFHRDELFEDIKAQVAQRYAGVDLALSETDKRARLKELEKRRLEADRARCASIWEAYESGETPTLEFPRDADARAVLGIEGLEPNPLRD